MRSSLRLRPGCDTRPSIVQHAPRPSRADCAHGTPHGTPHGAPPGTLRAHRAGRALVDVLVALVVLGVCGAATLDAVRAAIVASDRIAFVQSAHALSRDAAEAVQVAPCDVASGTAWRGRTTLAWTGTRVGPLASAALVATAAPHPASPLTPRALEARAGGWCR